MKLYSYIITRDYGFAPNPFPPYCTLATCKPNIRLSAQVGDWIVGIGSGAKNSTMKNRLIYAMQIDDKLLYDEYWKSPCFQNKKPVINGSKMQKYGDNIYHTSAETGNFIQENSHHSLDNGIINLKNYNRDLRGKYVLISRKYWYFGKEAPYLIEQFLDFAKVAIGHKVIRDQRLIDNFEDWLMLLPERGYIGRPCSFDIDFERYPG